MAECNSCPTNESCSKDKEKCMVENNPMNNVKKVIGVMSGKGGVGKSTISVFLAKQLSHLGYKVGILDADITGPSVPRVLGIENVKAITTDQFILPVLTEDNLKVISLNLLIENESDPVLWRGPMISGLVKQFWKDVLWEELDYLIIDMPPGTGDVALTVMQSIPISGVVMVSVPQDMVSMIVSKAVKMVRKMNTEVLGIVENMSYIMCPECDKKISIFESNNIQSFLDEMELDLLGELPMTTEIYTSTHDKDSSFNTLFNPIVQKVLQNLKED